MFDTARPDFLPPSYRDRIRSRRITILYAALFTLAAAGIIGAYTVARSGLSRAETRSRDVQANHAQALRGVQVFQDLQQQHRTMSRQIALSAGLIERVPRSLVLARLAEALPAGVSLVEMTLESRPRPSSPSDRPATAVEKTRENSAAGSFVSYDVSVKITGNATTDVQVARLLNTLNADSLFSDVDLQYSEELSGDKTAGARRQFVIDFKLASPNDVAGLFADTHEAVR